ncbi:MAG: hypothetical protein WKF77_32490, partial [Planctomycetaceae bacterium]
DGHCSLYVNGQRILKNVTLQKSGGSVAALGFDVRPLLRQGRNTVAVEVQASDKTAQVGITISSVQGERRSAAGGVWRMVSSVPPVGWQQTDFNDRDWPEAKPLTGEPVDRFPVSAPERFAAPVMPAKIRAAPFQFEDGDHVVFVGATFYERAQLSEHLEATLAGTCGEKHVTFRNLGWSADTVFADSRGIFDKPDVGYLRMVEHIRAEEPTVAFICYGQNEALTDGMTADQYSNQLGRLLDELAASGIVCVLVSPHELLPALPPIPSPSRFNPKINVFSEATSSVAQFEVNLFASDPMIAKPIQMNFDEDGRLWIASSEVYPQIVPGAPATDRVVVVEDADHDGVADKTHVFAEGLLIPAGVAPGDGGVWVANSADSEVRKDADAANGGKQDHRSACG